MERTYINKQILQQKYVDLGYDKFYKYFYKFDAIIYENDHEFCRSIIDTLFDTDMDINVKKLKISKLLILI